MTDFDKIASDLSSTGCGCDEDARDDCPNMRDGYCRYQIDKIAQALAAAYRAGQIAQAEEDAAMIKANTIQHSSGRDYLKPRYDGDRAGLAYAAAILANAAKLTEPTSPTELTEPTSPTDQILKILNRMMEDNKAFQRGFEEDLKRRVEANAERLRAEGDK